MNAVLYPVAKTAEAALNARSVAPRASGRRRRAPRRRCASSPRRPGPPSRAARCGDGGLARPARRRGRVRPARGPVLRPARGAGRDKGRRPMPVEPLMKDGRRWPEPKAKPKTVWRLSVSYWKVVDAAEDGGDGPGAGGAQGRRSSSELDPEQLARPDAPAAAAHRPAAGARHRPVRGGRGPRRPARSCPTNEAREWGPGDDDWDRARAPSLDDLAGSRRPRSSGLPAPFRRRWATWSSASRTSPTRRRWMRSGSRTRSSCRASTTAPAWRTARCSTRSRPSRASSSTADRSWTNGPSASDVTLGALVEHVLIHEIAHHLGLSDADIHRIEES